MINYLVSVWKITWLDLPQVSWDLGVSANVIWKNVGMSISPAKYNVIIMSLGISYQGMIIPLIPATLV